MEQFKEESIKELCGCIFYDINYQKDFNSYLLIDQIMVNIGEDFSKLVVNSDFKSHITLLTNMLIFGVVNFNDMFRSDKSFEDLNNQLTEIVKKHFQHPDIHMRSLSFEIYNFKNDD
jgi:hypothetical protein